MLPFATETYKLPLLKIVEVAAFPVILIPQVPLLYTAAYPTTVSSLVVCNRHSTDTIAFRISVAVAAAGDNNKQYLYYDVLLDPNDTFIAVVGLTLSAGDLIRVQTDTESVSFSLFGVELI